MISHRNNLFTKKLPLWPLALALGFHSVTGLAATPPSTLNGVSGEWQQFWRNCYDLNLPYFQKRVGDFASLMRTGDAWDKTLELEKVDIHQLNKEVCAKWGQSNNGESALREFTEKFSKVASTGISLKEQIVEKIVPELEAWIAVEQEELKPFGFGLEAFPCGVAFGKIQKHIQAQLLVLEEKIDTIREECPTAADAIIADAVAKGLTVPKTTTYGDGGRIVASMKGKRHKKTESTITGVKKAKDNERKSEEILKKQEEDAKEQNKEK